MKLFVVRTPISNSLNLLEENIFIRHPKPRPLFLERRGLNVAELAKSFDLLGSAPKAYAASATSFPKFMPFDLASF